MKNLLNYNQRCSVINISLTSGINNHVLGASLEFSFCMLAGFPAEVVEIQTATENRCGFWLQGDQQLLRILRADYSSLEGNQMRELYVVYFIKETLR